MENLINFSQQVIICPLLPNDNIISHILFE